MRSGFVLALAGIALGCAVGCASEDDTASVREWRGQYRIETSTCAILETNLDSTDTVRLHEVEPGKIALYTPYLPDGWSPLDNIRLEANGDGLTGTELLLLCGTGCPGCTSGEIRYARDDITRTSATTIRLELSRADDVATDVTCNETSARALAAAALTCTVEATYYAADRI